MIFVQLLQSSDVVAGLNIPLGALCWGFLYACVPLSGILLPLSLFFAVLYVVGRLASDRELLALAAGGIPPARLLWVPGLFGASVATMAAFLAIVGEPWGMRQLRLLWQHTAQQALLRGIVPGQLVSWDQHLVFIRRNNNCMGLPTYF